ncbi:beta-lactamase-like protein [Plectosphaerella plurivora]|uniref:Beta-lactamase-like protein n=1 Tax=Plectosphaerella plurivora TaxID=936078 RepID=A0A9P8VF77_9PEZI|nr:beta-lactamase-like protein [Plectosphaerella plurivora]
MATSPILRFAVHVAPPIPCVDIVNNTEAVLIDTPITIDQTRGLITWIEMVAPNRNLSYIYITHGHADHFLGLTQLLQRFPRTIPLATTSTVAHIEHQIEEEIFANTWETFFPGGQTGKPITTPKPLPESNTFSLQGRWIFPAIEVGHSDTYDSTILWVADLQLAVCGDVVYGDVHQMLLEANTKSKREEWIRAIERVEALKPVYVVPGHKRAEEPDGVWHLASTKQYLLNRGRLLRKSPKDPEEL